jgi:hypothetical protein
MSSIPAHGEMYLIQHYVIKSVIDLRQVGGFLWLWTNVLKKSGFIWNILITTFWDRILFARLCIFFKSWIFQIIWHFSLCLFIILLWLLMIDEIKYEKDIKLIFVKLSSVSLWWFLDFYTYCWSNDFLDLLISCPLKTWIQIIINRKIKQRLLTIPPISTKQIICSNLKPFELFQ